MIEMNEDNIIDVDYEDISNAEYINGKTVFYTTSQVAKQIGEKPEIVRSWCLKFEGEDILSIKTTEGAHRRFTAEDIKKLKEIKRMFRDQGLKLDQIKEYYTNNGNYIEEAIENKKPTAIEMVDILVKREVEKMKAELIADISQELEFHMSTTMDKINGLEGIIKDSSNQLNKEISITIDEKINTIKESINNNSEESKERDLEITKLLKSNMELRQKELEFKEKQNKKGFFSKLFNKDS